MVEAFHADLALIWLFPRMKSHVNLQLVVTLENLPTGNTRENIVHPILPMNLLVTGQRTLRPELLVAHPTLERWFFVVRPAVFLQLGFRIKQLCTNFTAER